jgi:hypothetical protein
VPQLRLNLRPATFQNMHRHLGVIAILERDRRPLYSLNLIRRQEPHSVYQYKIRHSSTIRRQSSLVPRILLQTVQSNSYV